MVEKHLRKTDALDTLLSLINNVEYLLKKLEIKEEAKSNIEELKNLLNELRKEVLETNKVGGFRVYKSMLTLIAKLTDLANSIASLDEASIEKFIEKINSFKEEVTNFKNALKRTETTLRIYRKFSTLSYIILAALTLLNIVIVDVEELFRVNGVLATIFILVSIISFTTIMLALNILQTKPKFIPVASFTVMVLAPYSIMLSYTIMSLANKYAYMLMFLQILGALALLLGISSFLVSIGILVNTTLPKIQAEISIRKVEKVKIEKVFKLEGKDKELYEKLIEKYNEMFSTYGAEMLKYEIDSLILSGLSLSESLRRIADRLNIHEETKTTEASGESNVNSG